jgi:hypothetical protein
MTSSMFQPGMTTALTEDSGCPLPNTGVPHAMTAPSIGPLRSPSQPSDAYGSGSFTSTGSAASGARYVHMEGRPQLQLPEPSVADSVDMPSSRLLSSLRSDVIAAVEVQHANDALRRGAAAHARVGSATGVSDSFEPLPSDASAGPYAFGATAASHRAAAGTVRAAPGITIVPGRPRTPQAYSPAYTSATSGSGKASSSSVSSSGGAGGTSSTSESSPSSSSGSYTDYSSSGEYTNPDSSAGEVIELVGGVSEVVSEVSEGEV